MAKQRLLIVDSDAKSLRVLEVCLRKAGYNITVAPDGEVALATVETDPPDLIISDIHMPNMDGYEFAQQVKKNPDWSNVPFIFLSRNPTVEEKVRGLELGVDDFLAKPIFVKEVVARVGVLLQRAARETLKAEDNAKTTFAGSLEDMTVVDLLQSVDFSRKSGILQLSHKDQRGCIFFNEGQVIDGEQGNLRGERAVYRLFTWSEGSFSFDFCPVDRDDVVGESTQAILLEGMRHLDEWGRVLEGLPPLATVFEIDFDELAEQLADIPDELNGILRFFDGKTNILEVVDQTNGGDLDALAAVSHLYFNGLLYDPKRERNSRRRRSGPPLSERPSYRSGTPIPQEQLQETSVPAEFEANEDLTKDHEPPPDAPFQQAADSAPPDENLDPNPPDDGSLPEAPELREEDDVPENAPDLNADDGHALDETLDLKAHDENVEGETPDLKEHDDDQGEAPDLKEHDDDQGEAPDLKEHDDTTLEQAPDLKEHDDDQGEAPDLKEHDDDQGEAPDLKEHDDDQGEAPDLKEHDDDQGEAPDLKAHDDDHVDETDDPTGEEDVRPDEFATTVKSDGSPSPQLDLKGEDSLSDSAASAEKRRKYADEATLPGIAGLPNNFGDDEPEVTQPMVRADDPSLNGPDEGDHQESDDDRGRGELRGGSTPPASSDTSGEEQRGSAQTPDGESGEDEKLDSEDDDPEEEARGDDSPDSPAESGAFASDIQAYSDDDDFDDLIETGRPRGGRLPMAIAMTLLVAAIATGVGLALWRHFDGAAEFEHLAHPTAEAQELNESDEDSPEGDEAAATIAQAPPTEPSKETARDVAPRPTKSATKGSAATPATSGPKAKTKESTSPPDAPSSPPTKAPAPVEKSTTAPPAQPSAEPTRQDRRRAKSLGNRALTTAERNPDRALELAREATELDPSQAGPWFVIAYIEHSRKNSAAAQTALERCLSGRGAVLADCRALKRQLR